MDTWQKMRAYPNNEIPNRKYTEGFEQKKLAALLRGGDLAAWEAIGPKNIGGRATFLEFHPTNPDIIFLGTASGGLWKTTTAGIGILKSIDGGATWTQSLNWSYEDGTGVQDLLINPQNSNSVYAATKDGLFQTTDGGSTWQNIHNMSMAVDIEMHPRDTNIVFISHGNFNGTVSGVYRSMNGGNSFQLLSNGIPTNYTGKTMISISPRSPDIIYASVANAFVSLGLYKSNDGGDSWANVNSTDVARYQGWYSHDVAVNPNNEDEIIYVGVDAYRSLDGGFTLSQEGFWDHWYLGKVPVGGPEGPGDYVHADIHMAKYHPTDSNVVFLATDGGLFVSLDNGDNWEGRNAGLQTQQFYANFSNSMTDSLLAMGGMQDNATAIYDGTDAWKRVIGGDGMSTAIDPTNDNIIYGSWQFLNIRKSTDGGSNFYNVSPSNAMSEQSIFSGPYELAPSNPSTIYAGAQSLFRSDNGGLNWHIAVNSFADSGRSIQTIAVAPNNPDLLYFSSIPFDLNSLVRPSLRKSINGGNSYQYIYGLPNRPIPDIAFDPINDSIVYLVLSGFGTDHVYKTIDAGANWSSMSAGLPDVPTNSIVVDPQNPDFVYVGSDAGVYFSSDGGLQWDLFVAGLPEAAIAFHLSISPSNRKLRVATHGNGVYESPLVEPGILSDLEKNDLQKQILLAQNYPNPVLSQTTFSFDIPLAMEVKLNLYDTQARLVQKLFEGKLAPGKHQKQVDLSHLAAGMYYYALEGKALGNGQNVKLGKMLLKD